MKKMMSVGLLSSFFACNVKLFFSSVNWDSVPLNLNLYKLYLGQAGIHSKKPVEASKKREPADIR